MRIKPGMRLRCIDAWPNRNFTRGQEYLVLMTYAEGDWCWLHGHVNAYSEKWIMERFKPIVRVKAGSRRV